MSFLKGAVIFLVSLVLFITLFFANVFLNLTWSLEHDTLKPNLIQFTNKFIDKVGIGDGINTSLSSMELYCMTHTNYIFMQEDIGVEVPCSIIDTGAENSISYVIEYIIDKVYYDEYNCEFWNCVKTSKIPFVLISEKAKFYWYDKFKLMIYIAFFAFALSFILLKKKSNAFINAGILTLAAAILFKQFDWVLKIFPDNSLFEFLDIFLAKSLNILIIMCIIGTLLLIIGILFRFFNIGTRISNIFRRRGEKKEISDESIKEMVNKELNEIKDKTKIKKKSKKGRYNDLTK